MATNIPPFTSSGGGAWGLSGGGALAGTGGAWGLSGGGGISEAEAEEIDRQNRLGSAVTLKEHIDSWIPIRRKRWWEFK
jgi:hypothetical protein